jgi:hypothetical protein
MAAQIKAINDSIINRIWEHVKSQPDPYNAFAFITVNDNNIIQPLIALANMLNAVDIKEMASYNYFRELKEFGNNYPRMLSYIIAHGGLGSGSLVFDYFNYNNFGKKKIKSKNSLSKDIKYLLKKR